MALASSALALQLCGCATAPKPDRAAAAKALFDQTVKQYHLPSAQAQGAEKTKLLDQAAAGYQKILREYRDLPAWCAPALRSLGNVRAEQGRLDEAVKLYSAVGKDYPKQDWEILQAWKSAADLLWDAGRQTEAMPFYKKIVQRFDVPDAPAVVKAIVRGSRSRLSRTGAVGTTDGRQCGSSWKREFSTRSQKRSEVLRLELEFRQHSRQCASL
jgi:tetratricopeptide (TPR) repeat protein